MFLEQDFELEWNPNDFESEPDDDEVVLVWSDVYGYGIGSYDPLNEDWSVAYLAYGRHVGEGARVTAWAYLPEDGQR